MKMTASSSAWNMFRNMISSSSVSPPAMMSYPGGSASFAAAALMSFDSSCSGRPSVFADTRTSRTRSRLRIDDGPVPGYTVATSLSGFRILSPLSSSLSVGTLSRARSSANRR